MDEEFYVSIVQYSKSNFRKAHQNLDEMSNGYQQSNDNSDCDQMDRKFKKTEKVIIKTNAIVETIFIWRIASSK